MARSTLPKTTVPGPFATDGVAVTWTAAVPADDHQIKMTGPALVLARNVSADTPATVTINSVALNGRTGDITADSIAFGAMHCYQVFLPEGWQQSNGYLNLEASSADIEFAVLQLR